MSGIKPGWLGNDFVMVHLDLVDALGGSLEAALLIGRLHYRAGTGWWTATRAELMEQTRLTKARLDRAVKEAREAGFIETRPVSPTDATLQWRLILDDEETLPTPTGFQEGGSEILGGPLPESGITSSKTIETLLGDPDPEPPKGKRRRATTYPPDYKPKPGHFDLAASLRVDLRIEGPQFRDHHTAKASKFVDWDAALRTWIRNAAKFRGEGNVIPIGDAGLWGNGTEPLLPPPPKRDIFG